MRLFFASWPPGDAAEALAGWAREVQRARGGRVVRKDAIHLTLAFLGDVDPDEARARARAVRLPATTLHIERARYWAHNRIVWVGPACTPPALANLSRELGEARAYEAHVTLIRKARGGGRLPPVPAVEWPVREFVLVNATLSAEGSSYDVLGRYALA